MATEIDTLLGQIGPWQIPFLTGETHEALARLGWTERSPDETIWPIGGKCGNGHTANGGCGENRMRYMLAPELAVKLEVTGCETDCTTEHSGITDTLNEYDPYAETTLTPEIRLAILFLKADPMNEYDGSVMDITDDQEMMLEYCTSYQVNLTSPESLSSDLMEIFKVDQDWADNFWREARTQYADTKIWRYDSGSLEKGQERINTFKNEKQRVSLKERFENIRNLNDMIKTFDTHFGFEPSIANGI